MNNFLCIHGIININTKAASDNAFEQRPADNLLCIESQFGRGKKFLHQFAVYHFFAFYRITNHGIQDINAGTGLSIGHQEPFGLHINIFQHALVKVLDYVMLFCTVFKHMDDSFLWQFRKLDLQKTLIQRTVRRHIVIVFLKCGRSNKTESVQRRFLKTGL